MKAVRCFAAAAVILALSLSVTLVVFQTLGWYHMGDMPTKVVLFRIILSAAGIACVLTAVMAWIREKTENNEKKEL